MPVHKLEKRTYLDADGKATTNESNGRSLLGIEGDEITEQAAYDAGLLKKAPDEAEAAPEAQMRYYNADGKRVKAGSADAVTQYLDNDPSRPDAPKARDASADANPSYDSMKGDDLKAAMDERGLDYSDMKVADMRAALTADDQKGT